MLSVIVRKFRNSFAVVAFAIVLLLLAIAACVPLLATCQTRLVQQRRANQFAIWSRSRFQVMRAAFSFSLTCIKAHLAKWFALFAIRLFGLVSCHRSCVHSCSSYVQCFSPCCIWKAIQFFCKFEWMGWDFWGVQLWNKG